MLGYVAVDRPIRVARGRRRSAAPVALLPGVDAASLSPVWDRRRCVRRVGTHMPGCTRGATWCTPIAIGQRRRSVRALPTLAGPKLASRGMSASRCRAPDAFCVKSHSAEGADHDSSFVMSRSRRVSLAGQLRDPLIVSNTPTPPNPQYPQYPNPPTPQYPQNTYAVGQPRYQGDFDFLPAPGRRPPRGHGDRWPTFL